MFLSLPFISWSPYRQFRLCITKAQGLAYTPKDARAHPQAPSGRELAPKATEGECVTIKLIQSQSHAGSFRHASRATFLPEGGFYGGIDILADTPKIRVDLTVGKPYNFQIITFKNFGAKFVFLFAFFGIVLWSINFYDQFGFVAVKIRNKIVYGFLSLKSDLIFW